MTSKCILLVSFYLDILISAGVWKIKSSWERFQLIALIAFSFCICLSKSRKQTPAKCRLTKIAKLSTKAIYQIFTDIPANVKTMGHVTIELRGNCTISKLFNNLNKYFFFQWKQYGGIVLPTYRPPNRGHPNRWMVRLRFSLAPGKILFFSNWVASITSMIHSVASSYPSSCVVDVFYIFIILSSSSMGLQQTTEPYQTSPLG